MLIEGNMYSIEELKKKLEEAELMNQKIKDEMDGKIKKAINAIKKEYL